MVGSGGVKRAALVQGRWCDCGVGQECKQKKQFKSHTLNTPLLIAALPCQVLLPQPAEGPAV
jgi:hypothetical protein